jgi:hypothetical protein
MVLAEISVSTLFFVFMSLYEIKVVFLQRNLTAVKFTAIKE